MISVQFVLLFLFISFCSALPTTTPSNAPPPSGSTIITTNQATLLDQTLGQLFSPDLANFTRTVQQISSCYVDQLNQQHLNIFNDSLPFRVVVLHYYNAFSQKEITAESITNLLFATKDIITTCLNPNRVNPHIRIGFTSLSDLNINELTKRSGIPRVNNSTRTKRQINDLYRPECSAEEVDQIPARFDWRDQGAVTRVRYQTCGSCWIYAAVGSIEGALLAHRKTNQTSDTLDLSERQLEDCTDGGCDGGWPEEAFEYVKSNGIALERDYRRGRRYYWHRTCEATRSNRIYPVAGYCVKTNRHYVGEQFIPDREIQQHLLKFGPLFILTSTFYDDYNYVDGIVDDPGCTARGYLNHAVLLIGYDEYNWIVKNSFGADWGENGFYRIARGNRNICGSNTEIAFVLLK